jgi:hypothetical protein
MSNLPPTTSGSTESRNGDSLADRVAARVINARLAIERGAGSSNPKPRRSHAPAQASNDAAANGEQRETQSLRRVFREMGVSYRRYRSQAGGPVVPGLRDAAYKFRAEPSLDSLVAVAAYLDELDLLS